MADTKETKITLFMGKETLAYKEKLLAIGAELLADGIDVKDKLHGGVSMAAVVRYLIDEEVKRLEIVQGE